MSHISIFYVSLVNVRAQFDTPQYILSQTKVTRSDLKKSLHLLLVWANRNEYFITCYYYGWIFDSGCLSMKWKHVIPHCRQIQHYTATVMFTHDYLDQYPKICLHNRKACCILPHSIYKQDRLFPVLPWPQECIVASVQIGFLTPGRFGVKAQSLTTAIYRWTNRCWGWRKNTERTRTVRNQTSTVPCPY